MESAMNQATGYRVRVECGDFFTIEDGDGRRDELFSLQEAIQSAEDFIADTEDAAATGNLQEAYSVLELEIVAPGGAVLSLAAAKELLATEARHGG